jgi:hypothetical protein
MERPMVDEVQMADDALQALGEISSAYRGERLGELAAELSHQLFPRMAFDTSIEERKRQYERVPKEFVKEAKKVARERGPAYQTPVFKCHGDYDKCIKHNGSNRLCMFLLIVCLGKHLIPFVPKGHDGQ